ncbi:gamma-glutamyltranspeptidase [Psychrosphaera saromensis]|uniref:Glutathione hydrolase proenzyme n=1 Tax=Psychrosphaera saromensis TaxID=716813 RepID=A0A2S7UY87_9GAMM|nr:gamma-glutamyltransferase [Psychrosphaera saromensis]PQJ54220.1 gamma-glutamyltransferase [Psychrosphaera saromensis]GHB74986.1 gamma-glutamyltranspeptidase [Psychrosphaera saromensis]GLQ12683.1 gamma-glutamyltranspeptidase [Psychrosphaera saromensis]
MRVFSLILVLFATPVFSNEPSRATPEAFTGLNYTKASYSDKAMVSAANPHAVNAGVQMLKQGGSAVDAAIAVQLVLNLVEPQSSGIGGGAFLMWYDGKSKQVKSYDGRETAPADATPELFLDDNGKPVSWIDAVVGGRSVGTPGVLKMLWQLHQEQGKLPWKVLFQPAIELADQGFLVSPRLAKLVAIVSNPGMKKLQTINDYFYPNGQAIQEGQLLVNKPYANTLKRIANKGVEEFYQGETAKHIVAAVQTASIAPGKLSLSDLKNYTSKERPAVCTDYKAATGNYEICSMGPPSSGGLTVLQMLKLLEPFDLPSHPIDSAETVHLYTQAAKLAFADRNKYLADSDFIAVPVDGFLNKDYLASRRLLISSKKDLGTAQAGTIGTQELASNTSIAQPNTSHMSIVDSFGNALSMTTTIEMAFGSTVMVDGFILNNQLTDFSLDPVKDGKLVANRVESGKRPRSSMSPVIVLKDGEVFAVLGSPGGSRIINYVAYALIGLLDYGLDMQAAANLPRVSNRNGATSLEINTPLDKIKADLEQLGHTVNMIQMTSGVHGILKTNKGWQGAADPRREGTSVGL